MRAAGMRASRRICTGRVRSGPILRRLPVPALLAALLAAGLVFVGSAPAGEGYRVVGLAIPESLTGEKGDPRRGERILRDADNATCLICHAIPLADAPDPGNLGPSLADVGSRLSEGELRLRLVDPKRVNPDTLMPSYYRWQGLHQVAAEYRGRPIYTAAEVEDVVAFLLTLVEE